MNDPMLIMAAAALCLILITVGIGLGVLRGETVFAALAGLAGGIFIASHVALPL